MSYDVDLFVIGGGSGGVRAARTAAATVHVLQSQRTAAWAERASFVGVFRRN